MKKIIDEFSNETLTCYQDDTDGICFVSKKTNNQYDLLDGKSYHGTSSSDITFVMMFNDDDGYFGLLTYVFGSGYLDDTLSFVKDKIEKYENNEIEPIDFC